MTRTYIDRVRAHYDILIANGCDRYGVADTPMWMAALDVNTGAYPDPDIRSEIIGKRVYRNIDAPRGCSLYWDQPALVAAHALSRLTDDPSYADAADRYVAAYLDRCVAANGILLWGNHYYYDAFLDQPVRFGGKPESAPCDMEREEGDLHEMRPLPPAWDALWRVSPSVTERAIRNGVAAHLFDPASGGFDRHAWRQPGCAFIEAGGILVSSLAWLYARTGDTAMRDQGRRIAAWSFQHRNQATGLLENNPNPKRWDKHVSTTEVGLWAGCLLQAADWCDEPAWVEMADMALSAWLRFGFDEVQQRFHGCVRVADGSPVVGPKTAPYMPGRWSDPWASLFPIHDYPMQTAEACLRLYRITGNEIYRTSARRWVGVIHNSLPTRNGDGAYAEHYGRAIHFLLGCARVLDDGEALPLAEAVAAEALAHLATDGLLRGHPFEDRYEAVDGVGMLALALLTLETGEEPENMAFIW